MAFLIVLGAILVIFVWVYIAKQFEEIAEEKGFSGKRYFWIPFLFGIIGWIMVAALPDRGKQTVGASDPQKSNNSGWTCAADVIARK